MSLVLTITEQSNNPDVEVQQKVFDRSGGTIGRSSTNNWVLPDKKRFVSSYHARIYCEASDFYLLDISTNGVYVNKMNYPLGAGKRVKLAEGDWLRIGEYNIAVSLNEKAQSTPADTPFDEWLNNSSQDDSRLIDESMNERLESSLQPNALSVKSKAKVAFQALASPDVLMRKNQGINHAVGAANSNEWAIDDVLNGVVHHIDGLRVVDLDTFDDDPVTVSGAFQTGMLTAALGVDDMPINAQQKKALLEKIEPLMLNSLQKVLNDTLKCFEPDNLTILLEGQSPENHHTFTAAYTEIHKKLIDDRERVFEPLLIEALAAACQQLGGAEQSE